MNPVTVVVVSILCAWISFSAMLVTIICMNSSMLSRIDEPFKDTAELAQERKMYREVIIAFASVNGCADCGDETPTQELLTFNGLCGVCFQGRCDDANKPLVPPDPYGDEDDVIPDDSGPGHSLYQ